MEGCPVVLNCAGLNSFWEPDRRAFDRINVEGTRNVMRAALQTGVRRIVHVSTVMAYGFPSRMPFDAASAPGPHMSDYARSKHDGDEAARELLRTQGLPLVTVYLAAVVGRGDRKSVMQIRSFAQGRIPVMIRSPNLFTYVHIGDAAAAIVRAGDTEGNVGERYLVGAERLTTEQYFGIISELSGVPMPRLTIGRVPAMALARSDDVVGRHHAQAAVDAPGSHADGVSRAAALRRESGRRVARPGLHADPRSSRRRSGGCPSPIKRFCRHPRALLRRPRSFHVVYLRSAHPWAAGAM